MKELPCDNPKSPHRQNSALVSRVCLEYHPRSPKYLNLVRKDFLFTAVVITCSRFEILALSAFAYTILVLTIKGVVYVINAVA